MNYEPLALTQANDWLYMAREKRYRVWVRCLGGLIVQGVIRTFDNTAIAVDTGTPAYPPPYPTHLLGLTLVLRSAVVAVELDPVAPQ